MDVIFFVYGLAVFTMGVAILAQPKEASRYAFARFTWLLVGFGLVHGVRDWMSLWRTVHGENAELDAWDAVLLLVSFVFLFEFGRRLVLATAVAARVRKLLGMPVYGLVALGFVAEFLLLPDGAEATRIASKYFLGFTGASATGVGFLLYFYKNIAPQPDAAGIAWSKKYFLLAALAFLGYGVVGGLVVRAADVFPANVINEQWFLATFHVPAQLLRAACAVLATFAVCNILAIFHVEIRERLQQLAARARASEARFRNTVEHAPIGMGVITTDGQFTLVNHALCKLLGYDHEALEKMNILDVTHPEHHAAVLAKIKQMASGRLDSCRLENRHVHQDGHIIWVQLTVSIDRGSSGTSMYLIVQLEDITERKSAGEYIWHQANFDPLTDLPNRSLFFDRLSKSVSQARRSDNRLAMLLVDLDGFKSVNDTYGHEAGDLVLKTAAKRLSACMREMDTLSRLGGDEFAVILGPLEDASGATSVAEKIIRAMDAKIALPGERECIIGASIGISIYPENATEMDSLLSTADAAMYQSKARGKNRWTVSSAKPAPNDTEAEWVVLDRLLLIGVPEIDEQHHHLAGLINQLNRAVKRRESDAEIKRLLDDLAAFTAFHFETENRLIAQYGFPTTELRDTEYRQVIDVLQRAASDPGHGHELLALQMIKDWLMTHIVHADRPLGALQTLHGPRTNG